MPDTEYSKKIDNLKKIDKSRVIEAESGTYFVQFAGENLGDEDETNLVRAANAILSTVGPKVMTNMDPTFLEHFQEVFPSIYTFAEQQQVPIGFPWGPLLIMAGRKKTDDWIIYAIFGSAGALFLWGANNLRKIKSDIKMTRRNFVFGTVKIIAAGLIAMKGAGVLASNNEPEVKLPENIPPEELFAATLAEALEQSSLKIRKERKLESKPIIYLLILPGHKLLLDYLTDKDDRYRLLNVYKDFLNDALPQLKTEDTKWNGFKELTDFYQNWLLAMYTQKNGKWGLQNYQLPLFK